MLNGLRRILSPLVLIGLPLPALAIESVPEFTVISTMETAEKGHNFRMLVEIDTEQGAGRDADPDREATLDTRVLHGDFFEFFQALHISLEHLPPSARS